MAGTSWRREMMESLELRIISFLLLLTISLAAIAQSENIANQISSGIAFLPESYRTPLSESIDKDNGSWRSADAIDKKEDNPWREDKENEKEIASKPRIKTELFPDYDYSYDPINSPSLQGMFLQNEFDFERPRTSIFKYDF